MSIRSFADDYITISGVGSSAVGTIKKKLELTGTVNLPLTTQIGDRLYHEGSVPIGCILMWSGNSSNVPNGWAICDGRTVNGYITPNLSGRFIICSGTGYNSGTTGGSATRTLTVENMPAHTHTGTTNNDGAHKHTVQLSSGNAGRNHIQHSSGNHVATSETNDVNTTLSAHTHNFTTNSTGSGTAFSIVPQYYSLIYIMKV
jgi:microcystin-dependent protein